MRLGAVRKGIEAVAVFLAVLGGGACPGEAKPVPASLSSTETNRPGEGPFGDGAAPTVQQASPPAHTNSSVLRASFPDDPDSVVAPAVYTADFAFGQAGPASPSGTIAWVKGDHRIIPYGILWGSARYDTSRASPGPYVLWVASSADEGEPTFEIDTRRTRIGLQLESLNVSAFGDAQLRGRVEIDFHGSFVVENKPGVLLRHAFGELVGDHWRLLAGQTDDIFSPLFPNSLNYSVGWAAGNIGYRRMQIRWEQEIDFSENVGCLIQAAIAQNIVSDFRTAQGVEPESTSWPILEGRVAFTLADLFALSPDAPAAVIGLGGHVGQQGFDFTTAAPPPLNLPPEDDARILTWSFNLDAQIPLTERTGVRGEFFFGDDLSTFLGGILQGVDPITRQPIRTYGGWVELYHHWTPRWHSYCGWSVDDPRANFPGARTYNQYLYVNATHDVTSHLNLGFEIRWWKTHFAGMPQGEAVHFEFAGAYTF